MSKAEPAGGRSTWILQTPIATAAVATIVVIGAALIGLLVGDFFPRARSFLGAGRPYEELAKTFDGPSHDLRQTIVVPTLDTPIPEGKSAIWCVSFQIAWNHLKDDTGGQPLRLQHAEKIADRLNRAAGSEADLAEGTYYAAGGFVKDGILERIRADMAHKFPDRPPPELQAVREAAVAYAFLRGGVKYTIPYFESDQAFPFTDSSGRVTPLTSFGIRRDEDCGYRQLRNQIGVLYASRETPPRQYIADVCRDSKPNQLVLAHIARKASLAETLAAAHAQIADYARHIDDDHFELGEANTFLVPNMHWRIDHHFTELEGRDKRFANERLRGLFLETSLETLEFKMDRSGAELSSESRIITKAAGFGDLNFDRPFLLYMQKRGADRPFFVMWVDNAELLCKMPDGAK